jgi:hypothetical protein
VPHTHVVQFGADDGSLARNAGRFVAEGVRAGGGIVIAAAERGAEIVDEIRKQVGDLDPVAVQGRLVVAEASEVLASFMVADEPVWERFDAAIGALVRGMRARAGGAEVRAYGEMVGLLWNVGKMGAADRLEAFWNRLLAESGLSLFCGYDIDVFGREFQEAVLDRIFRAHSDIAPGFPEETMVEAIDRAMSQVLGSRAGEVKAMMEFRPHPEWGKMPPGHTAVLWLRNHLPDYSDEILMRARHFAIGQAPA